MLVGVPVMVSAIVGAPLLWWGAYTNFGVQTTEIFAYAITFTFATIVLTITARAYWRTIIQKSTTSDFPPILNRVFPL